VTAASTSWSYTEVATVAAVVFAPTALVLAIAFLKGYNFHFTKHRINEHDSDKDKKDK